MAKKEQKQEWKQLLIKGNVYLSKGQSLIDEATKSLMREKGFKNWEMFDACSASGGETVIRFDYEGEMANLDIMIASTMTKEQIIKNLSRYMSDEIDLGLLAQ